MLDEPRILDRHPVERLDDYVASGGGDGFRTALDAGPEATLAQVEASGLRGRGGAGFPTGTKWRSVLRYASPDLSTTVVVNAAEGEPGSFKDRMLLRTNPYRVLEGALIAAYALGTDEVVVATKATFGPENARLRTAIAEIDAAGWAEELGIDLVEGPSLYLYGEETGLLEVLEGRQPFPRIAPPWRRGIDDEGEATALAGGVEMATADGETEEPPVLVNNVETFANVPAILAKGADWFRERGTTASPGTALVTVSGHSARAAVAEIELGTPLNEVLHRVGGGAAEGAIIGVMPGVSVPIIPASLLDVPLSYEALAEVGSGFGAGALWVLDETTDPVAVAAGVSQFLAVESCGQCTPCKQDGEAVAVALGRLLRADERSGDQALNAARDHLATVADGARCSLASQHEQVVGSLLALFPDEVEAYRVGARAARAPELIAPIVDLQGEEVVLDDNQATKQPDWTHGSEDSGAAPADRINQRSDA